MADDDRIEMAHQPDPRNTIDLGESRGKGLQMISHDGGAQGVTIVPDAAAPPPGTQGVVVSASDAANGPADFDG